MFSVFYFIHRRTKGNPAVAAAIMMPLSTNFFFLTNQSSSKYISVACNVVNSVVRHTALNLDSFDKKWCTLKRKFV